MSFMQHLSSENIADRIRDVLLREVYATPKPGLVDRLDNGAHTDMDVHTFEHSTDAITPYLVRMYEAGVSYGVPQTTDARRELFLRVRAIGLDAEREMFRATDGVNTHKGILFSMGLLVTAMGVLSELAKDHEGNASHRDTATTDHATAVCKCAAEIAAPVIQAECVPLPLTNNSTGNLTHGEYVFAAYGASGVRGEALAAFPVLTNTALPRLLDARAKNLSENDCAIDTLLTVMACLTDTNVLSRGGPDALTFIQKSAAHIQNTYTPGTAPWRTAIEDLNTACIEKNISPGGSADTLALALLFAP